MSPKMFVSRGPITYASERPDAPDRQSPGLDQAVRVAPYGAIRLSRV
jgi:hypothetical protein